MTTPTSPTGTGRCPRCQGLRRTPAGPCPLCAGTGRVTAEQATTFRADQTRNAPGASAADRAARDARLAQAQRSQGGHGTNLDRARRDDFARDNG